MLLKCNVYKNFNKFSHDEVNEVHLMKEEFILLMIFHWGNKKKQAFSVPFVPI